MWVVQNQYAWTGESGSRPEVNQELTGNDVRNRKFL